MDVAEGSVCRKRFIRDEEEEQEEKNLEFKKPKWSTTDNIVLNGLKDLVALLEKDEDDLETGEEIIEDDEKLIMLMRSLEREICCCSSQYEEEKDGSRSTDEISEGNPVLEKEKRDKSAEFLFSLGDVQMPSVLGQEEQDIVGFLDDSSGCALSSSLLWDCYYMSALDFPIPCLS